MIVPSAYEGQPLAIIEALACGLPCLASDRISELPEIVETAEFENLELNEQFDLVVFTIPPTQVKDIISKISSENRKSSHILETKLKQIDINNISPLEALNILSHLIKKYVK